VKAALDWRQPWLAPLADAGAQPAPVRFVAATESPTDEAYESFIARTGCVPTRDNLHDHFNRLIWHRHPRVKQRLNRLQAAEIAARGVAGTRGALRDALTLFDENGALWPGAPPRLAQALAVRDWHALFVTHRALWHEQRFEVFGHALLEQLATAPRKGLTAHVLLADPLTLSPAQWSAKPFLPLPVLGIPGWWRPNEDPAFYEDRQVFRPAPLKSGPRP
jgi:Protein of unknown function (DUF3025)